MKRPSTEPILGPLAKRFCAEGSPTRDSPDIPISEASVALPAVSIPPAPAPITPQEVVAPTPASGLPPGPSSSGSIPRIAGPITSLLDNPRLAATFVNKLACSADRARYLEMPWDEFIDESTQTIIRSIVERQGFAERMRRLVQQVGPVQEDQRIQTERLEEAEEELENWRREYRILKGINIKLKKDLEEERKRSQDLQEDLAEERERSQDLQEKIFDLHDSEDLLRAESVATESRLWQAETVISNWRTLRDNAFALIESKDKRLARVKAELAGRDQKHKEEISVLKEEHASALSLTRHLRLEELMEEPECQDLLLQDVASVCKRVFDSCKRKIVQKFPGLDLDDIVQDEDDL